MEYYFSKILNISIDNAVNRVTEALQKEGFGIVSRIDMHEKFKEKLGIDFKKYIILGTCNPSYAYKAVQVEEKIGVMLPCNVILIERGNNETEVAAVNPAASMLAIDNYDLKNYAAGITDIFRNIIPD
jgi:uncharacterized protein (DUF302 family)